MVLYLCAKKRPGRPRIYDSSAARKRAERKRAKEAGCKAILLSSVPEEYKALFDKFCAEHKMPQVEGFCYLLDLVYNFSDSQSKSASTHE